MADRFVKRTLSSDTASPDAGGPVDGVERAIASPFHRHMRVTVDTGGAFSAGDDLATDGQGRAVAAQTGDIVVARALEGSSGAGDTARIVKAVGRIK